jgi:LCP family protein required for cell wall assembly
MSKRAGRKPDSGTASSATARLLSARSSSGRRSKRIKMRRPKRWFQRRRLIYPLLFVASLLVTVAVLWWFSPVQNQVTGEKEHRGARLMRAVGNVLSPQQSLEVSFGGKRQLTLLLVGLDHVPPTPKDPVIIHRADSVLVARTDFDTKQIRLLSIPRDGWVEHWQGGASYGYDKLGHTYAYGQETNLKDPTAGITRTKESVEHLLGMKIDYYVVIQFDGLVKLVDALGGLDVDVEKDMKYRDRAAGLNIDLKKGPQHLDGEQVVQYARFRKDALGDIGRMGRQQKVLHLVFEKLIATRNPAKLTEIARILGDSVMTNLTLDQLVALCQHADDYPEDGFKSQTLPSYWNREPEHEIELPGVPEGHFVDAQAIFSRDCRAAEKFLDDLAPPPKEVEAPADGGTDSD